MIQGTSAVMLHAQVVLNSMGWPHVPPAGDRITWFGIEKDENGDVHVCPEATAGSNSRTGRIQTNPRCFQDIDFKTNTKEPFLYLLGCITLIAACLNHFIFRSSGSLWNIMAGTA